MADLLDIFLQLLDGVFQRRPGVINFVYDEDALSDQVLHATQTAEVQPLGAGDLVANLLDGTGGGGAALGVVLGELLVQRQADGLDGDVGAARLLQERSENASGDVATAADGDHEVGLEGVQDLDGRLLAQLVDLQKAISRQ